VRGATAYRRRRAKLKTEPLKRMAVAVFPHPIVRFAQAPCRAGGRQTERAVAAGTLVTRMAFRRRRRQNVEWGDSGYRGERDLDCRAPTASWLDRAGGELAGLLLRKPRGAPRSSADLGFIRLLQVKKRGSLLHSTWLATRANRRQWRNDLPSIDRSRKAGILGPAATMAQCVRARRGRCPRQRRTGGCR